MYDSIDYIVDSHGGETPEAKLRVIRAIRAYLNKLEDEIEENMNSPIIEHDGDTYEPDPNQISREEWRERQIQASQRDR